MTTRRTHYEILRVEPGADARTISRAYRIFAKRYHPDRDPSPKAHRIILAVNAAYEVLKHPVRRAAYDASLIKDAPTQAEAWVAQDRAAADREAAAERDIAQDLVDPQDAPREPESFQTANPDMRAMFRRRTTSGGGGHGADDSTGQGTELLVDFGRYEGWSLAAIARSDPEYLDWLARSSGGRKFATGIAALQTAAAGGASSGMAAARATRASQNRQSSMWRRGRG